MLTSSRLIRAALAVCAALLLVGPMGCGLDSAETPARADAGVVESATVMLPPEPEPEPRSFTMIAVGDVMLDRGVWRLIQAKGFQSILEEVRDELRSADITFANLECPLASSGPHAPMDLIFRADPRAVEVLLDGGVDIVSLANNHTLDAGVAGLMSTLDHLDRAGIAYCGAAREREDAWKPTLFEVNDVTLGFVACTDLSFQHGSWTRVDAATTEFAEHIRAAKERCELLAVLLRDHFRDRLGGR